MKLNRGISLLEVLLSLAIIAIILVIATRYFLLSRQSQQLSDATSDIQAIRAASQRWLSSHNDFSEISIIGLKNLNMLPANLNNNPWGGSLVVAPADNNTKIQITLGSIPVSACQNLQMRLNASMELPSPNTCAGTSDSLTDYIAVFQ